MTMYAMLKEKLDLCYEKWRAQSIEKIGIKSTIYWLQYLHWKRKLDRLTVGEGIKVIKGVEE